MLNTILNNEFTGDFGLTQSELLPDGLSDSLIDEYSKKLDVEGVIVIPNVFNEDQIQEYGEACAAAFEKVKAKVATAERKELEYVTAFDRIYYTKKYFYDADDGSTIIELAKGRYDFQLDVKNGVFSKESFLYPKTVRDLMDRKLKAQYTLYSGAVPAIPNSDNGPWHRDTYPLYDDGRGMDGKYDDSIETKMMHPFYYTLLIPLERLHPKNGGTEFISGSHKKSYEESKDLPRFQPEVEKGSVLLFDGRVFHRGRENHTSDPRMVLYRVYAKKWYNDY